MFFPQLERIRRRLFATAPERDIQDRHRITVILYSLPSVCAAEGAKALTRRQKHHIEQEFIGILEKRFGGRIERDPPLKAWAESELAAVLVRRPLGNL